MSDRPKLLGVARTIGPGAIALFNNGAGQRWGLALSEESSEDFRSSGIVIRSGLRERLQATRSGCYCRRTPPV